jgi:hypothetical protein
MITILLIVGLLWGTVALTLTLGLAVAAHRTPSGISNIAGRTAERPVATELCLSHGRVVTPAPAH